MRKYVVLFLMCLLVCPAFAALQGIGAMTPPTRPVDFKGDYADNHREIDAAGHDSTANVSYGWMAAHVNAGQQMDFAHNQDFARDSSTTQIRGLIWGYQRGRVQIGNAFFVVAAGTLTLTESQTTYVQLNLDTPGVIQDSTGWLSFRKYRPLFILRTNDTRVVGETDARAWIFISDSPSVSLPDTFTGQVDSGQSNFFLQDFDKDTGSTSGLSFVLRRGRIRTYGGDTLYSLDSTSIVLADTSNNFLSMSKFGVIFNDTNKFPDTALSVRQITTRLNAVVKDSDFRSFYTFPGNTRMVTMNGDERNTYAQNLREGYDMAWNRVSDSFYIASSATTWKEIGLPLTSAVTNSFTESRGYEDTINAVAGAITSTYLIGQADTGEWWLFSFKDTSTTVDAGSADVSISSNTIEVFIENRKSQNTTSQFTTGMIMAPAPINSHKFSNVIGGSGSNLYTLVVRSIGFWRSQ